MAEDEDVDEAESGSKSGGGVMMLGGVGLVALLLGAGAGFAGHMFLMPCEECFPEPMALDENGEPVAPPDRAVHSLNTFTVNLRGTGGGRVLRMEVQLEVDGSDLNEVKSMSPVLRDAVLTLASDYTYADLEGSDGKMRFRDELMTRLNGALAAPSIKRLYFTKFVVQ